MNTWFECKLKYEKVNEVGKFVTVTESYLVDALSHAEAENRIIEEMKPFISGEFAVASVRRKRISELFPNNAGEKWYDAKVAFISLDEEKGIEKRTTVCMMAQGYDIEDGIQTIKEGMSGSMADYEITGIKETSIMDVYVYEPTSSN